MLSKIKYILIAALLLLATYNTTKTTLEIYKSSKRLEDAKEDLASKESENSRLKAELDYKKSQEFIEQEARNKLNLAKPGERILVPVSYKKGGEDRSKEAVMGLSTEGSPSSNVRLWLLFLIGHGS